MVAQPYWSPMSVEEYLELDRNSLDTRIEVNPLSCLQLSHPACHTRTVLSLLAEATRLPLGSHATALTELT
jgi:hypothetical protein